jgi:uncharacterized phage protein (TIGR01671 family)
MRPIKFRQRIDRGGMHKWHYWGYTEVGGFTGPVEIDRLPSQQFTGLLDKNGKEIYESDIVKARHGRNDYEGYSIIKGEIKFENGQWLIGDYVMNYQNDNFEVIGNVYEGQGR